MAQLKLLQSLPPLNCSIIRGGLSFSDLYPVDFKDRAAIQRLYWSEVVAHVRRIFTGGSFQSSELSHHVVCCGKPRFHDQPGYVFTADRSGKRAFVGVVAIQNGKTRESRVTALGNQSSYENPIRRSDSFVGFRLNYFSGQISEPS